MLFEEEFFPGFGWVFPVSDGLANVGVGLVSEAIKKFGLDLRCFFFPIEGTVDALGRGKKLPNRV